MKNNKKKDQSDTASTKSKAKEELAFDDEKIEPMDLDEYYSKANIAKRRMGFFHDDMEILLSIIESKIEGIKLYISSKVRRLNHLFTKLRDKKEEKEFDRKYRVATKKHRDTIDASNKKIAKDLMFDVKKTKIEITYKINESKNEISKKNKNKRKDVSSWINKTNENLSNKIKETSEESKYTINDLNNKISTNTKNFIEKTKASIANRKDKTTADFKEHKEIQADKRKRFKERVISEYTCFKQRLAYQLKDFDNVVQTKEDDALPNNNVNQEKALVFVMKILLVSLICLIVFFVVNIIFSII